jgi:predicted dehydrogenase
MRIAIVGCGFVADYYAVTLRSRPELSIAGAMDRDRSRAAKFAAHHGLNIFDSLEEVLRDSSVDIVVNLTNPKSHFSVSKACLQAGKHVYSEKPLSLTLSEAEELVELAERRGLYLASAHCTALGETAQTVWRALRENEIGTVRLVYAEIDDGLVHRMPYRKWISDSGARWPYEDEFGLGCTLEHAGYSISWLTAFFGPVRTISAFSSCLIKDKETEVPLRENGPDFSVACMTFDSGVVARLTCSSVAPRDHSMRFIGDEGVLEVADSWRWGSPVYLRRRVNIKRRTVVSPWRKRYRLHGTSRPAVGRLRSHKTDFSCGVAELASAATERRPCRLSARYSLHLTEVVLAIHNALGGMPRYKVGSSFDPIEPMPWAN